MFVKNRVHCGICYIKDKSKDIKKQYHKLCFNTMESVMDQYCIGCLTIFYNKHKKKILDEINNGNSNTMAFLGYVSYKNELFDDADKYLLMSIEKQNVIAMIQMAERYYDSDNIDEMIKYYDCAVQKGNIYAMLKLGDYYKDNNYDLMKKYYEMIVCSQNDSIIDSIINHRIKSRIMFELGKYYQNIEPNYELMKKYYIISMNNSTGYYYDILDEILHEKRKNMQIDLNELFFSINDKDSMIEILHFVFNDDTITILLNTEQSRPCDLCFVDTVCYQRNDQYVCSKCYL